MGLMSFMDREVLSSAYILSQKTASTVELFITRDVQLLEFSLCVE